MAALIDGEVRERDFVEAGYKRQEIGPELLGREFGDAFDRRIEQGVDCALLFASEEAGAEKGRERDGLFVAEDVAKDAHTVFDALFARLATLFGFFDSPSGVIGHGVSLGRWRRMEIAFVKRLGCTVRLADTFGCYDGRDESVAERNIFGVGEDLTYQFDGDVGGDSFLC